MKPQITLITRITLIISLLCALCGSVAILGGCGTAEKPVASREERVERGKEDNSLLATRYSLLISQLGSDDWQTRETAHKKLIGLGEKLIEQYRKEKKDERKEMKEEIEKFADILQEGCKSDDAEIRMRADLIRRHFYARTQPKIAFTSSHHDDDEIYVIDPDGRYQKNLTKNKHMDGFPSWSPDGTKIAYISERGGHYGIYVMDIDGKNQKRLTRNKMRYWYTTDCGQSPTWSPDGKKIAFVSFRDGNSEIYVMDANGKNKKNLTKNKADDGSPTWNSDSTKIAFQSNRDDNWEIYVMDANGKNQKRLTENKAADIRPDWAPDGAEIAFVSTRDGNWQIYVMDVNGKNIKIISDNRNNNGPSTWSSDGTKIAFLSERDGNSEIYVMDADGKNEKKLTGNKASKYSLDWGPWILKEISRLWAGLK